jgi:protein-S-isoprenylcysteine O-methyltransferase Ste14
MTPLYLTDGIATGLYGMTIIVWLVSEFVIGVRQITLRAGDLREDRWSGPALLAGVILAMALGAQLAVRVPGLTIGAGRPVIFALGILTALGGIAFRQYAVAALGRFFTTRVMTQPGQTVVESGPYRYMRHPSYSGMLLTVIGVLLCSTNWASLACFVLALPGVAYRIRVEEGLLIRGLGEPYREYMRRTPRLVPFLV